MAMEDSDGTIATVAGVVRPRGDHVVMVASFDAICVRAKGLPTSFTW